jgi:PTS system nitrogen regulatory IIA component
MRLSELLSPDRILILAHDESSLGKLRLLSKLADLLAPAASVEAALIEATFVEREAVQSTGIGGGVAIPHGAMAQLTSQCAALIVSQKGVEFASIDGAPVHLVFGVVGPKHAAGVHLKTLARISRVLRNRDFCLGLSQSADAGEIYSSLVNEDAP